MIDTIASGPATKRPRRMAREPKPAGEVEIFSTTPSAEIKAETAKPVSKSNLVLAMLQRPEGATIAQLLDATGWLPHTTRAALRNVTAQSALHGRHSRQEACCAGWPGEGGSNRGQKRGWSPPLVEAPRMDSNREIAARR